MSTHDYNLANQSGASFRSDLNNALAAILSNNSNGSAPSTTVAYSIWADTSAGKLKIRNSANDDWVDLINLDGTIQRDISLTGDLTLTDKIIHSGDTNTAIRFPAADTFTIETAGSERFRVDSSGNCGLGVTSPTTNLQINTGDSDKAICQFTNSTTGTAAGDGFQIGLSSDENGLLNMKEANAIVFKTTDTERARITSGGKLAIGTTNADSLLAVVAANSATPRFGITNPDNSENFNISSYHDTNGIYVLLGANSKLDANGNTAVDSTNHKSSFLFLDGRSSGSVQLGTAPAGTTTLTRIRISSDNEGTAFGSGVGTVSYTDMKNKSGTGEEGARIRNDGAMVIGTSNNAILQCNRRTADGTIINIRQDGASEGSIDVSGSTVSYNGGHLSRWSQLSGISSTDKSARPTIYQGTVMSNLDELCVWTHAEVLYDEDVLYDANDEATNNIPSGKNIGDVKYAKGTVKNAAYTEENQQLNLTKISDTEGDKDVAGVFWAWDDEDDEIVNDFFIAMTGDMVIRVAASTTVARGDLLISAGDGTAKPQADDIIRSSTIAKIISTNYTATYADGSKAYPCVLMAC